VNAGSRTSGKSASAAFDMVRHRCEWVADSVPHASGPPRSVDLRVSPTRDPQRVFGAGHHRGAAARTGNAMSNGLCSTQTEKNAAWRQFFMPSSCIGRILVVGPSSTPFNLWEASEVHEPTIRNQALS
jgi:hypothetical protein